MKKLLLLPLLALLVFVSCSSDDDMGKSGKAVIETIAGEYLAEVTFDADEIENFTSGHLYITANSKYFTIKVENEKQTWIKEYNYDDIRNINTNVIYLGTGLSGGNYEYPHNLHIHLNEIIKVFVNEFDDEDELIFYLDSRTIKPLN
ncbi:MAG: hypothetical protein LUF87_04690 [Alistipes sp.]|nr:hypothetical protein [Alistipes sp.]